MKWIKKLNLCDLLNRGVTFLKKREHLVFISNDINDEPDFSLEVFDSIENKNPALYKGFIKKCFGNFFKNVRLKQKQR